MQTYLQFLTWLAALGNKLPQAAQYLQVLVEALVGLGALFNPRSFSTAGPASVTVDESAAESKVLSSLNASSYPLLGPCQVDGHKMFGAPKGAWDGTLLRQIWAFLQAHPEIITLLLSIFKIPTTA